MEQNPKFVRRSSFKAGISASAFRAQREERAISISKEKRFSKTNSLRKKLIDPEENPEPADLSEVGMYHSLIFSDAIERQYAGAVCFRKLLASDGTVPYEYVLQPGIIPRLCSFLAYRGDSVMELLDEATWVVTNIACGGNAHVRCLIESNAVELLLGLLPIRHPKAAGLREQALWALGNIAVDSAEVRMYLIQKQLVSSLLSIVGGEVVYSPLVMVTPTDMDEPSLSAVKHIAWICSTMAGIKNDGPAMAALLEHDDIARPLVFMLTEFLQSPDNDVQADAYNGLAVLFETPSKTIDGPVLVSHQKCIQWALEEGILFKLTETLDSDGIPCPPPPPPPAPGTPPPHRSPRPSPLRVVTLPEQSAFNFTFEGGDSGCSTPDTTPGGGDPLCPFPPPLSSGSRHGGKHVRRNSKGGNADSPHFFRDSRTGSGDSPLVPPLLLDPAVLEPAEGLKSFIHSPGTGSALAASASILQAGPIAAVMSAGMSALPTVQKEVGEIDVIKNLFERNGRSPLKNARQVATRSDNSAQRININRSAGHVRLSENPVKLSAVHAAAILLSTSDCIQQQIVMLPRYDFLGKIVQLVAHDIQTSGNTRGLFADSTMEESGDMDLSEEYSASGRSNVGGNSSVVYDVMTCIVAVLRGTSKQSNHYIKQIVYRHKVLDLLEYFFGRDHYETTLVTGEAFFLLIQELICSPSDIVNAVTLREFSMIYGRLLELMTIADARFLSCLLATLFDLLLFFDKLNNIDGGGKYGAGAYDVFFAPIERLNSLLNHPNSDISSSAEKVEELLEKLASRNNL